MALGFKLRRLKAKMQESKKISDMKRQEAVRQRFKLQQEKTRIAHLERQEKQLRDQELRLRLESSRAARLYRGAKFVRAKIKKHTKSRRRKSSRRRRK